MKEIFSEPLKKILASKDSLDSSQALTCAYILSGLKVLMPRLINLDTQRCSQVWEWFVQLLIKAKDERIMEVEMEEATLLMKALVAIWPCLANKQQAFKQLLSLMSHVNAIVRIRVANTLLMLWQADSENTIQLSEKLISIMNDLIGEEVIVKTLYYPPEFLDQMREFCSKLNVRQVDFIIDKCLEFLASKNLRVRCKALWVLAFINKYFSVNTNQFSKVFSRFLERIRSLSLENLADEALELQLMLWTLLTSSYQLPIFPGLSFAYDIEIRINYNKLFHCNSQQAKEIVSLLLMLLQHLVDANQLEQFPELTRCILASLTLYKTQLSPQAMSSELVTIINQVKVSNRDWVSLVDERVTLDTIIKDALKELSRFVEQRNESTNSDRLLLLMFWGSRLTDSQLKEIRAYTPGVPVKELVLACLPCKEEILAYLKLHLQELIDQKLIDEKNKFFLWKIFNLFENENEIEDLKQLIKEAKHCSSDKLTELLKKAIVNKKLIPKESSRTKALLMYLLQKSQQLDKALATQTKQVLSSPSL